MSTDIKLGDVVRLSKAHTCGSDEWEVVGVGTHTSLEWMGIGMMLLALTSIITNLLIINRKGKVN
jgi:hypothetical protein